MIATGYRRPLHRSGRLRPALTNPIIATSSAATIPEGPLPMFASLSRRRFLALSTATAIGATLNGRRPASAALLADAKDAWGGFPVGVQSYSLRNYKLPEAIRH